MRRRLPLLGALAAAAVLIPAAASQAATISYENGAIVYRGEGSEGLSLLLSANDEATQLQFSDDGASRQLVKSGPCDNDPSWGVVCDLDPSTPVKIYGSDAKDQLHVYFHGIPESMPIEIHGGAADDDIQDASGDDASRAFYGDGGNDTIKGYGGNDYIDGGDGNDEVDGGAGNDSVHGGAGNDTMWGDHYDDPGADVIDGGPGFDTTQDWSIPSDLDNQPAVDVTLDGVANDGRPGEGDNVTGVEKFQMYVVGRFVGSGAAENINIYNPGNQGPSTLIGNGGDDTLIGNDYDDSVDGGPGNDHVEGGMGNDVVTGGPGQDIIYGDATASSCTWYSCQIPFGNDVINARDGEQDNIDCGIGTDKAIVDAIDVVANCETVDVGGASGPGGPGGGKGGSAGGGGGAGHGGLAIAVAKVKLRALAGKGLTATVRCGSACTVSGSLTYRGRKVGSGRRTALKAGDVKVRLKLTKAGKKALKRVKKAKLTVKLTVRSADGGRVTGSRTLTVKR
jgi:hemolysin type calcium-binding protein